MYVIGIDPGASGAAVVIADNGAMPALVVEKIRFRAATECEIGDWFYGTSAANAKRVAIEDVHSMPKDGVASAFKFGQSYGFLRGILAMLELRFDAVAPRTWQKAVGVRFPRKATRTQRLQAIRARAQELYPGEKWTNADAAAVLIAEYCRRMA